MKLLTIYIISLFLLLSLCHDSYAIEIRNVDKVSHELTIVNAGEKKVVEIKPGNMYRTMGTSVIIKNEGQKDIRTRVREEYMIKNGIVHLQKRGDGNSNTR